MYENDKRIVLTLDAGGTNFVFSAIRGNIQIVSPVCMPSCSDNLDRCLATLVAGFDAVIKSLDTPPVAISFAFPGPADYKNGVIGETCLTSLLFVRSSSWPIFATSLWHSCLYRK